MADRRVVDELTIEELEQVLYTKRREARLARIRQRPSPSQKVSPPPLATSHRAKQTKRPSDAAASESQFAPVQVRATRQSSNATGHGLPSARSQLWNRVGGRVLLLVEVIALAGLIVVVATFLTDIQTLNREAAQVQAIAVAAGPTTTPGSVLLPGGSTSPTDVAQVPEPFRDLVQSAPVIVIPTPGPQAATRIVIPAIDVDAPVVEGDRWEELKRGVGHHIGSANPGERGNVVLSGHDDVFGEVFRRLTELTEGDIVQVYDSAGRTYKYRVATRRIVAPTEVSVMDPTTEPIITLITCYPYLVDTQRLIVIGELVE